MSDGDTVRVAMRQVCDAIGMNWPSQYKKIMGDEVLSKGVVVMTTAFDRHGQEMVTLPLELLHGWLFMIDVSRVNAAARPKVIAYQRECYQVLHDYWVKGSATNPRFAAQIEHSDRTARRRELPGLLDRYETETNPEKRRIIYALIVRACESEGINPPAHDAIGYSAPRLSETMAAFWGHVAVLEAKGDLINYHRNPNKLAFRRKQLEEAFCKNGIDLRIDSAFMDALKTSKSPLFEAVTGVNTKLENRKTVYAWVFDRTQSSI